MDGLDRKGFKRAIPVVSRGSFIRMIYALRKRFNTLAVILPFFFLLNSRPPVLFSPPRRMTLIWLHYNIISTRPRAGSFQYGMCAKPTPAWMSLFFLIILSSHRLSIHNSVWNEIFVPPSPLPASERTSEIRNSDTTNDWKRRNAMRRAKRFLLFFLKRYMSPKRIGHVTRLHTSRWSISIFRKFARRRWPSILASSNNNYTV